MQLIFHTPINALSLGQVGYNLLRECYKRNYKVGWFPVGQTDISAFKHDAGFFSWLEKSAANRWNFLGKGVPAIVNWHIVGSERLYSYKQVLLTYHECDTLTSLEKAVISNQYKTLFCGAFSEKVAGNAGLTSVGSFDLGFDEEFCVTGKKYLEGKIHFGLIGKWENRKHTEKLIRLWAGKYGNNKDYSLSLLVNNPFYGSNPQETANINASFIQKALDGKRYWNINPLPRLQTNAEVNELTNSLDIDISGLGAESWGLPSFNATCLGKWAVVLNGAGQKDWANRGDAVLVEQSGWRECYDDAFFKKGAETNQGFFPKVEDDAIVDAFERAEKKVGTTNEKGISLGKEYTYSRTFDQILYNLI